MPMPTKPEKLKRKTVAVSLPPDIVARMQKRQEPGQTMSALFASALSYWLDATDKKR